MSMLNPSRNDFKRTRFDNNIPGGQQQPGSSNPQQPMTNSQYAEQRRNRKQGNNETLASLIAVVVSKINTDTNFLSSWILINQPSCKQLRARGYTNPHHPPCHNMVMGDVLLDTGSLPGDFISQELVHKLHGDSFVYTSPSPLTICSGLDNTCYVRDQVVDIGLSFVTHSLVIKTIYLTVRIIPNSIDLILDRQTLKKLDFFSLTPFEMGMPNIVNSRKRLELLYTVKGICPEFDSSEKNKRCLHSGVGTLPVHSSNTDRVAKCLDVECQSSAAGAQTMRDDCNYVSTHSGVACTRTHK